MADTWGDLATWADLETWWSPGGAPSTPTTYGITRLLGLDAPGHRLTFPTPAGQRLTAPTPAGHRLTAPAAAGHTLTAPARASHRTTGG